MFKATLTIVFLISLYQVKAQFAAASFMQHTTFYNAHPVNTGQQAPAADSVQYVFKRAGLFQAYRLYHGDDYIPFTGKRGRKYTPELKSHFAAYPLAHKTILASERYHTSATISLGATLALGAASAIIGLSTANQPGYDPLDLTFDVLAISSALTTTYLFHKSNVKKRKAVDFLNARQ